MTPEKESEERRTLVVDDHEISGKHAVTALRQRSGIVRWARTASEALVLALHWQPHTIVLDLNLPDQSGLEVLGQIFKGWPVERPAPNVVVLTGEGSGLPEGELAFFPISRFLVKPVSGQRLREAAGLVRANVINENGLVDINAELPKLFRNELQRRLPELDSSLSVLDRDHAIAILHQLIASAAMSGERDLESALRTLDGLCRNEANADEIARDYHAFLESAREFIARERPRPGP